MKPTVLITIADDKHKGEFRIEFSNLEDLQTDLQRALTMLLGHGRLITEQLTMPLQLGGVPMQKSKSYPANWSISACLNDLKRQGLQWSNYGVSPDRGWTFNLV